MPTGESGCGDREKGNFHTSRFFDIPKATKEEKVGRGYLQLEQMVQ